MKMTFEERANRVRVKRYYMEHLICLCKKCLDGEMVFLGSIKPSYPAHFLHQCNKCGFEEWITGEQFPVQRLTLRNLEKEREHYATS